MPKKTQLKKSAKRAPAKAGITKLAKPRPERAIAMRPAETLSAIDLNRGKYVYCVIQSAESLRFGGAGIGDNGSEIHTIHHRDLAAVVSDVPLGILDSTRENVLAHERVNEIVTVSYTHLTLPTICSV